MALTQADLDTTARTVWGEARGEPYEGKVAVAWVVRNRAAHGGWWGQTPHDVCVQPYQFSCWNLNDPNREKMMELDDSNEMFTVCIKAVKEAFAGTIDPTDGATHYAVSTLQPAWAVKATKTVTIGNHTFYKDVP